MDYNNAIFECIDTIVNKRLEDMAIDQTIVCTISNDADRAKGHYLVKSKDLVFDAYCENTLYREGQQVQVLIPGGDYSAPQKTIIGRYSSHQKNQPITYLKPFDSLVLLTDNLIPDDLSFGLTANGKNKEILLYNLKVSNNKAFTSIGLRASFKTLLSQHIFSSGTFGLKVQLIGEKDKQTIYNFKSDEMIGNPYAYGVFTCQEKKIDITNTDFDIQNIKIYLYQNSDFIENNRLINPSKFQDILVSNLELYFAGDIGQRLPDSFEIIYRQNTYDGKTSAVNIDYFWYHVNEKGKYIGLPKDTETYNIKWFYYNQGVWSSLNLIDGKIPLRLSVKKEYIKAILYLNEVEYESNTLIFENKAILNDDLGIDRIAALGIVLGKNSKNIFAVYGEDNSLLSLNEATINRELSLSFTPFQLDLQKEAFFKEAEIFWYIPKNRTMLNYDYERVLSANFIKLEDNDPDYFIFKQKEKKEQPDIFSFQLQKKYNFLFENNTIKCKVQCNDVNYWAEKSFSFSSLGNNGTDYSITIISSNNKVTFNNKDTDVYLSAHLDDPNGKSLKEKEVSWQRLVISDKKKLEWENIKTSKTDEFIPVRWIENSPNIIRAVAKIDHNLSLTSLYPLIYNKDGKYSVSAPTHIIYGNTGTNPKYYKGSLELFELGKNIENVNWDLRYLPEISSVEVKSTNLLPKIINKNQYPTIQAPLIYSEDTSTAIILQASYNDIIVWEQPIIIQSNAYAMDFLNNWDGKINIDNDNNTIMSAMIGAGIKDKNNTFSGVLMGNVSKANSHGSFGLYGYNEGLQSFKVGVDGIVSIGKAGLGQIIIDGNGGRIESGNYKIDNTGMLIDLKKGHLISGKQNTDNYLYLDSMDQPEEAAITINGHLSNEWRIIAGQNFGITKQGHIHAASGSIGGWKLDKRYLSAAGQKKYGIKYEKIKVPSEEGETKYVWRPMEGRYPCQAIFAAPDIIPDGAEGDNVIFTIGANDTPESFRFNPFRITQDGSIYAKQGKIGGWIISDGTLYAENTDQDSSEQNKKEFIYLSPNKNIIINIGDVKTSDSYFNVTKEGAMSAKNANIKGTIIADQFIMRADKAYYEFSPKVIYVPNINNNITMTKYVEPLYYSVETRIAHTEALPQIPVHKTRSEASEIIGYATVPQRGVYPDTENMIIMALKKEDVAINTKAIRVIGYE